MEFTPPIFHFFNIGLERWEEAVVSIENKEMPCGIYYVSCIFQSPFFVTLQQKMNAQI